MDSLGSVKHEPGMYAPMHILASYLMSSNILKHSTGSTILGCMHEMSFKDDWM